MQGRKVIDLEFSFLIPSLEHVTGFPVSGRLTTYYECNSKAELLRFWD